MIVQKAERKKGDYAIARLKRNGKNYELLIDSETALKARKEEANPEEALLVQKVFKDAKTGDVQGDLEEAFGTDDMIIIAKEIINKGEIQLSEEYRKKVLEDKTNKVINEVTSKATDPQTHYPIPRQRIELGMEKAGFKIRYEKNVNEQVNELMEALKKVMPITFNDIIITINSPAQFTAQIYGIIKKSGEIIGQNYLPDNSTEFNVKVQAGQFKELSDKLKGLSHGLIKIKEA